jgi:hypothetical protein
VSSWRNGSDPGLRSNLTASDQDLFADRMKQTGGTSGVRAVSGIGLGQHAGRRLERCLAGSDYFFTNIGTYVM